MLFAGRHPTLGYYAYPAAFTSIALGKMASELVDALKRTQDKRRVAAELVGPVLVFSLLLLAFLPGAGLRTLMAHMRHRNDRAYDAHALAGTVMKDIPPRALTAVDGAYVLDFYLAGRPVIEATIHRLSYDFRLRPYEYVVFARDGLRRFRPLTSDLTLLRSYGDRSDPFAPYAALYRRSGGPRNMTADE
jgi:hypothetical protein